MSPSSRLLVTFITFEFIQCILAQSRKDLGGETPPHSLRGTQGKRTALKQIPPFIRDGTVFCICRRSYQRRFLQPVVLGALTKMNFLIHFPRSATERGLLRLRRLFFKKKMQRVWKVCLYIWFYGRCFKAQSYWGLSRYTDCEPFLIWWVAKRSQNCCKGPGSDFGSRYVPTHQLSRRFGGDIKGAKRPEV